MIQWEKHMERDQWALSAGFPVAFSMTLDKAIPVYPGWGRGADPGMPSAGGAVGETPTSCRGGHLGGRGAAPEALAAPAALHSEPF